MPIVCLVRHGQASFGAENYDVLSDLGHRQARIVAAELRRRELRDPLFLSGSLDRQLDTAGAIAEVTGWGPVGIDDRWNEYDGDRIALRHASGPTHDEHPSVQDLLDGALIRWIEAAENGPGGSMTFREAGDAALDDLTRRLGETAGRDAVVVTSGGVIAGLCASIMHSPAPQTFVALNRLAVNTAITTLLIGRSGTSLASYNDHAHLLGEHRALLTYR